VEDWRIKQKIEKVLEDFPSYGHKRIADALKLNKKRIRRVMKLYGIKPYRRHRKPWKRANTKEYQVFPNLLLTTSLVRMNQIWVTDFTFIFWKDRFIYLATVMDIFNREIVGACVLANHSSALVIQAMVSALMDHKRPDIIHSDQGREHTGKMFQDFCTSAGYKSQCQKRVRPGRTDIKKVSMTSLKLTSETRTDLMIWENWYMKSTIRYTSTIPLEFILP